MPTRLLALACAVGALAAACSTIPQGTVVAGSGSRFVVQVADSVDNVGLGNAIALDKNGVPYLSYWGFTQKTTGIPVSRPIGAPFIPAVQVSSLGANGIWTRGAAAEVQDPPSPAYVVPYGPATVKQLKDATANNTNGTDIAVASDGTMHVVWTAPDGVYYAKGSPAASFTATQILKYGSSLSTAGPIGPASVAVDSSGTPWVAYIVNASTEEVRLASPDASGTWRTTVVDTLPQCGGCPQPGAARVVVTPNGPAVAFANGKGTGVLVATQPPSSKGGVIPGTAPAWIVQRVASGVTGSGLSAAVAANGNIDLAFYTGDGAVDLASSSSSGWTVAKVADAAAPTDQTVPETTGIAVDNAGKIYLTWYDGKTDSVVQASGDGSTFTPMATPGTVGGKYPSLAVTSDGAKVFVAWYVSKPQDLQLGIEGTQPGLAIAYPSPSPSAAAAPTSTASPVGCPTGGVKLEAPSGASVNGFAVKSLSASASKSLTLCFTNADTGVQHNVDVYDKQGGTSLAKGNIITGPAQENLDLAALKPGSYFFQCDVHPTIMTGTLTVK